MTNVGNHVKCPQCDRKARVVWVSQDGKTIGIRCMGYHSHGENRPPPKTSPRYVPKAKRKYVTGMVFLVEASKKE